MAYDNAMAEKGGAGYNGSNSSGEHIDNNQLKPELTHDSVLGMQAHGHPGDNEIDNPYVHQTVSIVLKPCIPRNATIANVARTHH
jgi:hypothetical protein